MAARGATGRPGSRRRCASVRISWQNGNGATGCGTLGSGPEPAKRNAQAETENNARLAAIDARIKEIDKELAAKFPDYAALTSPAPLGVEEVQAQLGRE